MTSTIEQERTETSERDQRLHRQNRILKIVLLVVVVIALALGGILLWSVADDDSGTAVPDEVEQVLDDFVASINSEDYEALLAVTTDDFVRPEYWTRNDGVTEPLRSVITLEDFEDYYKEPQDYVVTNIGDPLINGDGPWFVSLAQRWETPTVPGFSGAADYYDVVYTFSIVDDDGTLKVDEGYWTGVGPIPVED